MWKLIALIVAIVFFTIFFIQNMVKVPVRFIATDPVNLRLTYVIIITFVAGYLCHGILYMAREIKMTRKRRIANEDEDEDDDDFID